MDATLKNVCTANLGIMYTQLITSWVENRLLAYVKVSNSHSSNPSPPPKYSYLPNWLTV